MGLPRIPSVRTIVFFSSSSKAFTAIGEVVDGSDGGGHFLLNVDDGKTFTPVSCLGGNLRSVVLTLRSGFGLEVSAEVFHEV